jgi:phosphoglycolate phosphatase-like HAD superfamily hydrolase
MKAVIFDFDDTLIVSRADRAAKLMHGLQAFGFPGAVDRLDEYWGLPFRELVLGLSPQVESRFNEFLLFYSSLLKTAPPTACEGVLEALPILQRAGPLFVHSLSHSLLIRTELQSLGLLGLFDFICGSDWQLKPKPNAESLRPIMDLLLVKGVSAKACIYVGDSPVDAELARRSGLTFVAACFNEQSQSTFLGKGECAHAITSLAELATLIETIGGR